MCFFICDPTAKKEAPEVGTKPILLLMSRKVHGYARAKFFKVF
jgi:hypothetical protein